MLPYTPKDMLRVPAQYLRENPRHSPTHVVILGAGASIQAFPNGDANGVLFPQMDGLVEVVGLQPLLRTCHVPKGMTNFEALYSYLSSESQMQSHLRDLENAIFGYFSQMKLPEEPTLYDHLLLSLRSLDIVATFNWDPLLFDSWRRLADRFGSSRLPSVAYLHGNVGIGYCPEHKIFGENGRTCDDCDNILTPTRLLYPIQEKDYASDMFIKDAWERLQFGLENALAITVFGYGAPESDKVAVDTMKFAWSGARTRKLETVFIVDVKSEEELRRVWKPFLFSHHFKIQKDFYSSFVPRFARRCGEALIANTLEGCFVDELPIPRDGTWDELAEWFRVLAAVEDEKLKT